MKNQPVAEPPVYRPEPEAPNDATAVARSTGLVPKTEPAAEPRAKNGSEITWRWATAADMQALQLLHFQAEAASGQAMYLPEGPSTLRAIAVAEKDGKIVGGQTAAEKPFEMRRAEALRPFAEHARPVVI